MAKNNALSEKRCQIILALAECDMNVTNAAKMLDTHMNTVRYQIGRIFDITGKNPMNFYDLCDLVLYVKAERNRKWVQN